MNQTDHFNPLPMPCPLSSPKMTKLGNRTSHCHQCNKTVHNLSGLSLLKVVEFVKLNPGVCVTLRENIEVDKDCDR